ncbi:PorT family protein [Hymenobacter sp. BT507]|uniref:PorT family protein n=1 Tax=Hymenobacter citatus TaxID=2763506 RepID=A0ABR7MF98_9BACT|nr:porin family protein [Hymenobacter citatus]MBC6609524.1 PorT family protein [Hymenobacter citatus]
MAATHFRHQLHLYCAQIGRVAVVAALAVVVPFGAHAQKKSLTKASRGRRGQVKSVTSNNLPGYDDRWFHPGFYIAPNFSGYRIQRTQTYIDRRGSGLGVTANTINSPGFSVGFVGDARLLEFLSLRFAPGVSFMTRRVEFKPYGYTPDPNVPDMPSEIQNQEVETTQVDFPILLKFHSQRRRNTRVYMVGGIKPSVNVGNRIKDPENNLLRVNKTDLAIEYGVGLDLFYPLFKFAPELRFSHGLRNIQQKEGQTDVYNSSLQRMSSHTVTLYLNFE